MTSFAQPSPRASRRGRRIARWAVVVALVAVLGSAPWALGRLAVRDVAGAGDVSAAALLTRVQRAADHPWSGYAESRGGLSLPVTTVFPDLADLAGGTTTSRAWWRADDRWRIDVLSSVGERDVVRDASGAWSWDYQADRATRTAIASDVRVRLPQAVDLLPPTLGARLTSEARPGEASRLPDRRIAGRDALGLRLRPAQAQASIDRVDLWADAATGVPLRVDVVGAGAAVPAVSTTFLDVSLATPDDAAVTFTPPTGARVEVTHDPDRADLATAVDRLSRARPPAALAGLPRSDRTPGLGAVGVYGRGVTELVAVPLLERYAGGLRGELTGAAGATTDADGAVHLGVGPLNLLVTAPSARGRFWLLAGTVTAATLTQAATDLAASPGAGQ